MTKGIHHITAIASNAQATLDFYTHILGLRLVKKTVNQDDPKTYHLFFGDAQGHPGMDLTFFIFLPAMRGIPGNGLVTKVSFAVPESSLSYWENRLTQHHIKHEKNENRFGHQRITFFDPDNLELELVGVSDSQMPESDDIWVTQDVSKKEAIRHFYSATLSMISLSSIQLIVENVFGYTHIESDGHTHLFAVPESKRANFLEVSEQPSLEAGLNAAGTVHHIAFRADDEKQQQLMRQAVINLGLYPTDVIDRFYFKSVYFRTPAGILFEIATDGPGFTADQRAEDLGTVLSLPPFLEPARKAIEANLAPLVSTPRSV